ncbi:MAG: hypothetical protein QM756_26600 [Polyangiaceae bacterium]
MTPTNSTAHLFPCEICGNPGVIVLDRKVTRVVDEGLDTEDEVRTFDANTAGHVRCAEHCGKRINDGGRK